MRGGSERMAGGSGRTVGAPPHHHLSHVHKMMNEGLPHPLLLIYTGIR